MAGGLKASGPAHTSDRVVPNSAINSPDAPTTIFNNFTTDPAALYDAINGGYYVGGPTNPVLGASPWVALPFATKAQAVHAKTLSTAIGYDSGGMQVRLRIFTDAGGVPGTAVGGGTTTTIPPWGVCCATTTVNVAGAGVALLANTKYWLVADNTSGAQDFLGVWQASLVNDTIGGNVANGGWFSFSGLIPAAKISGTVP
jgi:hypothetical protein